MSEITNNNGIDMVEENNNNGNASGGDQSQRRRQQQQQQPEGPQHMRRMFQGQPPRGFRIARRYVHQNNSAGIDTNVETIDINSNMNDSAPQHPPLNDNVNGNSNNANRHHNVQRLRVNMRGRNPFMVRQQQQRPNAFFQTSQQHQQQQSQQSFMYHPMGPNGPVHIGPNGPLQVRMVQVQVDPLAPQPLPASNATNTSTQETTETSIYSGIAMQKVDDPPKYERYKCEICYEYLNDPVGCGKCASRFCRACLQRVYESNKQKQQPTKCPVCRCEYDEMVPDLQIYGSPNGESAPTLPCRYVCIGCPERNLPLSKIAKHEQVCDHVPMRCRYAPYGCSWIGKRGLIKAHEEFGCKLAPMGAFVEQFRQNKADHTMRLEMIAQQATGSLRMSHVLRQTYTRDNQRKSLSDTLRLFQYCHAVTGLTPHFLMTKDLWVSYWRNNESRAAVVNFCVCVPFLSAALGVVGHSTGSFFELFEEASPGSTLALLARVLDGANINNANKTNHTSTEKITSMIHKLQQSETEELLITTFLGTCVGTLGILVVILNHIDTKSNISWTKISLPYIGGSFPLFGDVLAIAIFTLLLATMEYHQSNVRAMVLWTTIVFTSTFFPALIFSISHYTARLVTRTPRPAKFNLMEMARMLEPCMFGLRFSMMISYFGVAATLDASVLLSLVPLTSQLHLKNTLFDHMPRKVCLVFLTTKSAFWVSQIQFLLFGGNLDLSTLKSAVTVETAQHFFTSSPDGVALSSVFDNISVSILATASLMVTSCIINNFFDLGISVGDYIALTSQGELSPEGIARGTAKEYSSVGLIAFGSWMMMIALLARI